MAAHQCATWRLCGVLRQLQPRTAPCAGPGDELVPEARAIKLSNDDMELLRAATLATGLASLSSAPFDVSGTPLRPTLHAQRPAVPLPDLLCSGLGLRYDLERDIRLDARPQGNRQVRTAGKSLTLLDISI